MDLWIDQLCLVIVWVRVPVCARTWMKYKQSWLTYIAATCIIRENTFLFNDFIKKLSATLVKYLNEHPTGLFWTKSDFLIYFIYKAALSVSVSRDTIYPHEQWILINALFYIIINTIFYFLFLDESVCVCYVLVFVFSSELCPTLLIWSRQRVIARLIVLSSEMSIIQFFVKFFSWYSYRF